MRRFGLLSLTLLVSAVIAIAGFARPQSGPLDARQLREKLVELGYDVTDLVKEEGKEKYTVKLTKSDLDIPIGYEISPSKGYIWLTVNLGDAPAETSTKCLALLKSNGNIQPSFFYVTKSGRLMMGLPIDNRDVTNATLRLRTDQISDNVGSTKDLWQG
ncbi:MAG: hypothetical protein QOJ65_1800 [Fimbriimonadaceae bacterium]|jgi:hypothetical protein|nr:hypothetical protein [Fimbriimonadaceae bacterium]